MARLYNHQIEAALHNMQCETIASREDRRAAIVKAYLRTEAGGRAALIISITHEDLGNMTRLIQAHKMQKQHTEYQEYPVMPLKAKIPDIRCWSIFPVLSLWIKRLRNYG